MSDDHSELEPPLPIPNRAVKRLSANDSADYPCESRTSSGTHRNVKARPLVGLLRFCGARVSSFLPATSALQILQRDDYFAPVAPLERLCFVANLKAVGVEFERAENGIDIECEKRLA